jgi:DNA polymerase-3 subunit delta'
MSYQEILGHDEIASGFAQRLAAGRLGSTYLFVGPEGVGKKTFALALAKALLCPHVVVSTMLPCGQCESCKLASAGNHPDLLFVCKPEGKSALPVKLLIGEDDKRMREGLCHDIGLKPFLGGRRVAIIDDADDLQEEGANCLLKTLEEPPPQSVLILIGTSTLRQLPTIRSRCQIVRFQPLSTDDLATLLLEQNVTTDATSAKSLAELAGGSFAAAQQFADESLQRARVSLLNTLSQTKWNAVSLTAQVTAQIDEAGKETSAKRIRACQLIGFVCDLWRQTLRAQLGMSPSGDVILVQSAQRAAQHGQLDESQTQELLARSLETLGHIDANANVATALAAWLEDLAKIASGVSLPLVARL